MIFTEQVPHIMTQYEAVIQARDKMIVAAKTLSVKALEDACLTVIHHPKFLTQVGSAGAHHAYEGGLMIHTCEVMVYARQMALMFPNADMDVVTTAAIWHDFHKIHEYVLGSSGISKTPYRNLVRHVAGSHAAFMVEINGKGVSDTKVVKIEHAMLAHHGRREWGSPVEPILVEARILHYADMFSVNYGNK